MIVLMSHIILPNNLHILSINKLVIRSSFFSTINNLLHFIYGLPSNSTLIKIENAQNDFQSVDHFDPKRVQ